MHPSHHHLLQRKGAPVILLTFVIVLVGYGGWRIIRLHKENTQLTTTVEELRGTVAELQNNLSLSAYERDRLTFVLDETQQHEGVLAQQTEALVGTVEKLQTLDPELLKKYSKVYFLNEHYAPSALADVTASYINGVGRTLQVHAQAWPYLERLLDDSTDAGLGLLVTSAYRSFGTQAALKSGYKVTYGAGTANSFSADQGYSEHQLGTTVDLTTIKTKNLSAAFDTTAEYTWLGKHAYEYGFTLSYPKGNKYYIYEPWHWRFVGVALATTLHDEGKHLYDLDQRDIDPYLLGIFD